MIIVKCGNGYLAEQMAHDYGYGKRMPMKGWGDTIPEAIESCMVMLARYNKMRWPAINQHKFRHGCPASCTLDHSSTRCTAYFSGGSFNQCLAPREAHTHV